MTKILICNVCRGENIRRDAWAEWDSFNQQWTLADIFDYAYCLDCDQETELEEVESGLSSTIYYMYLPWRFVKTIISEKLEFVK